jgi:alpha-tubulin suppressor-like RCC1 family protein
VTAGDDHSCALQSAGTVRCWGLNGSGQLGNGTTTRSLTSVAVTDLSDAKALGSGRHNCAIRASGSVVCWGSNNSGQLGDGTQVNRSTPVPVTGLTDAVALSVIGDSTCAVRAVGTVVCWGEQFGGQVMLAGSSGAEFVGVVVNRNSTRAPVAIAGLADVRVISIGVFHGCAIIGSGAVQCWGFNGNGELGNGPVTTATIVITPVTVTGITNAVALSTGFGYSCALLADKTIKCWGNNAQGQLGDGSTVRRFSPVAVNGLTDAVSVSGSIKHTCALRTGGALSCWGDNSGGQLGDGTQVDKKVPTPVLGGNIFFFQ